MCPAPAAAAACSARCGATGSAESWCRWRSPPQHRSEEHTSELQSHSDLVCRLLLEKKKLTVKVSAPKRCVPFLFTSVSTNNPRDRGHDTPAPAHGPSAHRRTRPKNTRQHSWQSEKD